MVVFMNGSLKQLLFPVVTLMSLLSTQAVGNPYGDLCIPTGKFQTAERALTVCKNSTSTDYQLDITEPQWPSNFTLDATENFQIRSCGHYSCNRAAWFAIYSQEEEIELKKGQSSIPLKVTIKQNGHHQNEEVLSHQDSGCYSTQSNCPFGGSGLTHHPDYPDFGGDAYKNDDDYPENVNFQIRFQADLKELINQGTLTESGKHEANFELVIQQHITTVNMGSGTDAGKTKNVTVTMSLDVPDLIQITGLNDMYLTGKKEGDSFTSSQDFCVFRLGGQKFKIKASGSTIGTTEKRYRLVTNDNKHKIPYTMAMGPKNGTLINVPPKKETSADNWFGDCKSWGDNLNDDTNMKLEIKVIASEAADQPTGRYQDRMTLIVKPD